MVTGILGGGHIQPFGVSIPSEIIQIFRQDRAVLASKQHGWQDRAVTSWWFQPI